MIPPDGLAQANYDLLDRIEREGIALYYNHEADTLSLVIGEPREGVTEPMIDDIFCRLDPESLKVIGVEIVAFRRDFLRKNKIARKVFSPVIQELVEKGEVVLLEASIRRRAGELLAASLAA